MTDNEGTLNGFVYMGWTVTDAKRGVRLTPPGKNRQGFTVATDRELDYATRSPWKLPRPVAEVVKVVLRHATS